MTNPFHLVMSTIFPPSMPEGWQLRHFSGRIPDSVVIDAELLSGGHAVREVRLPFMRQTQLRAGSSLLLLAAAVTATADMTGHVGALLHWSAKHGFNQEKFLARCPIQRECAVGGQSGRIVRDGAGERIYAWGSPSALSDVCPRIWDGGERSMDDTDRQIIRRNETASRQLAWATASVESGVIGQLTYLGSLTLAEAIRPEALEAIETIRAEGISVCATGSMSVYANDTPGKSCLRLTADDPEQPCLYSLERRPADLAAPVLALVDGKQRNIARLKRCAFFFLLALAAGFACDLSIPALSAAAACMGLAGLFVQPAPLCSLPRRCVVLAAAIMLSLVCRAFLGFADPALARVGCNAFAAFLLTCFALPGIVRTLRARWLPLLVPLLMALAVLLAPAARLQAAFGAVAGTLSAMLLTKIEQVGKRS